VRPRNALLGGLAGLAFVVGAVEVSLRVSDHVPFRRSLAWKFERDRERAGRDQPRFGFVSFDSGLGYRLAPGSYDLAVGATQTKVDITEQGLREARTYPPADAPDGRSGAQRIATVGCSFTFGFGVEESETWSAQLEERLDDTDVINLGVLGYGQDQSLLRLQEDGPWNDAGVLVLGLVARTSVRNLAAVSPFSGVAFPKPRFVLEDDGMTLFDSLPSDSFDATRYDEHGLPMDAWARAGTYSRTLDAILAPSSEAIHEQQVGMHELTARLLTEMSETLEQKQGRFVVLYMPERRRIVEDRAQAGARDPLVRLLSDRGMEIVDPSAELAEWLDDHEEAKLFAADGQHPGVPYHEIAARKLAAALEP